MARATSCVLDGEVIDMAEALRRRDRPRARGERYPAFACRECGAPVRPHREGSHGGAHMEHRRRNPACSLSDPLRSA